MRLAPLYKASKNGKIQECIVEVEGSRYRTIGGYTDGVYRTHEWTQCVGKNIGRENETSPEEQALREAKALHEKKIQSGYSTDRTNVHGAQYVEPMLAENYDDYRDVHGLPPVVYSQSKLDGVRCIVKNDGMWSRTGKKILSAPHIREALQPVFDENPDIILDGELYNHDLKDNFNKIVSLVRKSKPTQEDLAESKQIIEYWIYDVVDTTTSFVERFENFTNKYQNEFVIQKLASSTKMTNIWIVGTAIIKSATDLDNTYRTYVKYGFEGQMVRLDKPYENKRSKNLLKRKEFKDEEFKILDIVEGNGDRSGMVGYMVFEREGKRFKSNVKGPHEYLAKVLTERDTLIGKTATVQFFDLTPDGIPRFPYVINIAREIYE